MVKASRSTLTPRLQGRPTIIVGAGPAGLAVAASLKARGLPFEIIERQANVGASFRSHYRRLHLHTDKALSALPFMPFPEELPRWVPRADVVRYLESYAQRFDLRPRFGVSVLNIQSDPGGGVLVETDHGQLQTDSVVVATGYNRVPILPEFEGLSSFVGPVVHSSSYLEGAPFRGQRVLVIGAGNSGAEIALDLWEHGAHPRLLVRGPVHVVPREIMGVPLQRLTLAMSFLSAESIDRLAAPISRFSLGDLTPHGLVTPQRGAAVLARDKGRIPVLDVGTIALIRQGLLPVLPAVRRFHERSVECVDGRSHAIEAVVLATGYRSGLSALLDDQSLLNERELPKRHGTRTDHNVWFIGFSNPQTGALREIGIEAQRIAKEIMEAAA
jgi:indole-3-pyruvate monooxygenase